MEVKIKSQWNKLILLFIVIVVIICCGVSCLAYFTEENFSAVIALAILMVIIVLGLLIWLLFPKKYYLFSKVGVKICKASKIVEEVNILNEDDLVYVYKKRTFINLLKLIFILVDCNKPIYSLSIGLFENNKFTDIKKTFLLIKSEDIKKLKNLNYNFVVIGDDIM